MPRIRALTHADLSDLMPLIAALAAHHGDVPTVDLALLERDLTGPTPWLHGLVAEEDFYLVAYAALCPTAQLHFGRRGMDIHHLFIQPTHRGKGLGRRMIDACIQKATLLNCDYLTVGTTPENEAARAAYVACGFRRTTETRLRMDF